MVVDVIIKNVKGAFCPTTAFSLLPYILMLLHNCFKAETDEAVQIPWSGSNLPLVSHYQGRRKSTGREILYIVMGLLFVHRPSLSPSSMFA